jgi:hypothetical protein
MTIPTGNGECRGPESADGMGTPLPGTRPSRAAANNARFKVLDGPVVMEQSGMGTEDMECSPSWMGADNRFMSEVIAPVVDLAAMGDGGETFGGM